MKIAIHTLHLHSNYGGILQAFALQTVLTRMGHNVIIYNRFLNIDETSTLLKPYIWIRRFVSKYLLKRYRGSIFQGDYANNQKIIINTYTRPFVEKYINEYYVRQYDKLSQNGVEAIVVGSDQIWRKIYYSITGDKRVENSYLDFAKDWNIRRISYAASFGTDVWELTPEETKAVSDLAQRFDAISVREKSGVDLCKNYLKVNAIQTIDPTMLLNSYDYIDLIDCRKFLNANKGSIMTYVLDEDENNCLLINDITRALGLPINKTNVQTYSADLPIEDRIQPPVEQWLAGFADAEYVVTDSFHACVFSILFKKPFIVIGNEERGQTRFNSLLSLFCLENRMVKSTDIEDSINVLKSPIDWNSVYDKLDAMRLSSINFLVENLK